jgi:hypothetical protein
MLYGIDVSHHQNPGSMPWEKMNEDGCDFCIVRLTYGLCLDKQAPRHIERARQVGMKVGAYLFFRPSQPVDAQLAAFREAALVANYGHKGDIVPVLDFEDDTEKRPITPEHSPLAERMMEGLMLGFSSTPLLYITQRDWGRAGKPAWALTYPLWVAHYSAPSRKEPATPAGRPWAIWQHRVGKWLIDGPAGYYKDEAPQLDQNRAQFLPLIGGEVFQEASDGHSDADERAAEDDGDTALVRALATEAAASSLADNLRRHAHGDDPNEIGDEDEPTKPDLPENIT